MSWNAYVDLQKRHLNPCKHEALEIRILWRGRECLIQSFVDEDYRRMHSLFKCLSSQRPSKTALAATGIGWLLNDASVWSAAGETSLVLSKVVLRKWKTALKGQSGLVSAAVRGQ